MVLCNTDFHSALIFMSSTALTVASTFLFQMVDLLYLDAVFIGTRVFDCFSLRLGSIIQEPICLHKYWNLHEIMSDFIFVHKFWKCLMTVSCLICHLPIVHFNAIICIADFAFILFLKFSQKLRNITSVIH